MGLSDFQRGPAWPSRVAGWSTPSTALDLLCCLDFLSVRAVVHHSGRVLRCCRHLASPHRPSPSGQRVGPCKARFRSSLDVHSGYSPHVRWVAYTTLCRPRLPMDSLPPPPLRLLPAGTTSCRVGIAPTENPNLTQRTPWKGD